jgi:hypothetical protein
MVCLFIALAFEEAFYNLVGKITVEASSAIILEGQNKQPFQ